MTVKNTTRIHPTRANTQAIAPKNKSTTLLKVVKVAALSIATIALVFLQAPVLIAGFIIGMIFQPQARKAVDRIKNLWLTKPWEMVGVTILSTIIAGPVVIISSAFITGSYLGMRAAEAHK